MQGGEVVWGPPTPLCQAEAKWKVRAEQKRTSGLSSVLIIDGTKSSCEQIQFQYITHTVPPSQFSTVNIPDSCLMFSSVYHSSNPLCLEKHGEKLPEAIILHC